MAIIDRKVSESQLAYPDGSVRVSMSAARLGTAAARRNTSPGPSKSVKVTNTPTARKARSLTTLSNAIAATIPSCRSLTSVSRAPNRIVNSASRSAT